MKDKIETLKKWVSTGQVNTAKGRNHDDLLTLIGQMERELNQHIFNSSPPPHNDATLPKCERC